MAGEPKVHLPVALVKRVEADLHRTGVRLWVVDCPLCGREHVHGAGPGHRAAHCAAGTGGYLIAEATP